jgi:pimeloyl-ACP methyl ester carboxylesterase
MFPLRRPLLHTALLVTALLLAGLPAGPAQAHRHRPGDQRPIIFVHGFSGSAGQYETQARRFAGNGYPAELIEAHEYDSTFTVNTIAQVHEGLDARIDRLLARTRADRVDLVAHSLGTSLMQAYLNSSPQRAARVAHYVNLDGATAAAQPGGVPTLAVWGEGSAARAIVGATNLYLSDQAHTQTVTSPESFTAVYRFLTGREPRTTRIVPEHGSIQLSGRAVLFPLNVGVSGARLEVYEVGPLTGRRLSHRPVATFPLADDGAFGPFRGKPAARYEFAIVRDGSTHHLYYEAFHRSDRLIRLLTSEPGTGLSGLVETSTGTTALVINRNKEWWGDQGTAGDTLLLNGTSVLNAANAPRTKRVIGIFAYDAHLDGQTDLAAPIPAFFAQPFITGMDVFLPAAPRHAGIVSAVTLPRGGGISFINAPNWPSAGHRISLQFDDYR